MRALKWTGAFFAVLLLVFILFLVFGMNTLRGPVSRAVTQATGRELLIEGDFRTLWSWGHPRFRAEKVSFANPEWASEEHMFRADAIELTVRVLPLLIGRVVLPEVHLERPEVFLELTDDGQRNWLLDRNQKDEGGSRVHILSLTLDEGYLQYDQPGVETHIEAELSTDANGLIFSAKGQKNGLQFDAAGRGGPALALRDNDTAYPLKAQVKVGPTAARLEGSMTNLVELSKFDLAIELNGKSLSDLYDVIGIAFPETTPYRTSGRLLRDGKVTRYENFTGKVGESDLAGTIQVDTSGKRAFMSGEMTSRLLKLADLGAVVGTQHETKNGVLPDRPFDPERWASVDADVKIRATKIERPEQLPIENLATRIQMRDRVLTLDPLEFGIAGGKLVGPLRLDGTTDTIRADLRMRVQKLQLAKLFPTIKQAQASIGDLAGVVELHGVGNSVAKMLGSSDGKIGLFIDSGQISPMMAQMAAMDLWGMAKVKLQGRDKPVEIRCAIADFGVKDGLGQVNAFIIDTEIVNLTGEGSVNLKTEEMDLKLKPHPKDRSIASLKSPLYIRGTFSAPQVGPDMKKITAKGVGAVVMGILNPLLAVLPLLEKGEGKDSPCAELIAQASASAKKSAATTAAEKKSAAAGASAKQPAPQRKSRPPVEPGAPREN
jgi:AsmA protein